MKNIFNAQKQELVDKTALELKKINEITPPEWAIFVKTGTNKSRPPILEDWWYTRSASMLLKILNLGPIGVSKLSVKYGSKKRRGHTPAEFRKSSSNIIRKALQQMEKAGLVKQDERSGHKGRIITPKGISLLDTAAKGITVKSNATDSKQDSTKKKQAESKKPVEEKKKPEAVVKKEE